MRLWIDTDVGTNPDDAIALLLACAHPDVDLAGVSTTGGDEHARAEIARELLASAGADGVRVVGGPSFDTRALLTAGVDALLAIGPLTNVARVVRAGSHPPRLAVMGGVFGRVFHRGRWRDLETNLAADPAAAATVLEGAAVLLTPLDVTARVCLDDDGRRRLSERVPALRPHLERWEHPVCLHDPVALLALLGEQFVTVSTKRVRVDEHGRLRETDTGRAHHVVVGIDEDAAISRTLQLLDVAR